MFLGYSSQKKGYKCYDPIAHKLYISRDVVFAEKEPYYKEKVRDNIALPQLTSDRLAEPKTGGDKDAETKENNITTELEPITEEEPRRSTRIIQPSTRLKDFVTYQAKYPIQDQISYDNISPKFMAFLSAISKEVEPSTFWEANNDPRWRRAMKEELEALERNETWDLTSLPEGKKPVGCKWVYKIKYNSNGSVERYKARLVAKGFTQTYGVDYQETFAPVAKMNTVRILLSLATNMNWLLYQMDVKNAFLQGTLEEEVYMTPPPGFTQSNDDRVCKLKKSIYGLKQSPRAWYGKLSHSLLQVNFVKSTADSSVFVKHTKIATTIVLVYVDDIIITGSSNSEIENVKKYLQHKFDIKDLGTLRYFLGIEIAHSSKGLFLSQRKYTLDLLKETGKLGVKPANTPMEPNLKVDPNQGESLTDISQFQRLVGKLIYLTVTRPDISFAVSTISQFMHAPRTSHMEVIDRILRYLKKTPGQGIWMRNNNNTSIIGYSDADWAGNYNRKSTTGYCTFVGGNLVTWKSKKQNVVARSSAEAEYRAMASTASELIWIKQLLTDLKVPHNKPMPMYCDNQAARHIASNPVFHERTKHIEVDCHFVREKVQNGEIETPFVRSQNQLADIFTKSLDQRDYMEILPKLGSLNIYEPNLRGSVENSASENSHHRQGSREYHIPEIKAHYNQRSRQNHGPENQGSEDQGPEMEQQKIREQKWKTSQRTRSVNMYKTQPC